ncbi:MAG: hypothetical protein JW943_12520 [Deltaproteobacteria bacterium]|nr:hypothetical protein [Deltaproteobacteria bacterium]
MRKKLLSVFLAVVIGAAIFMSGMAFQDGRRNQTDKSQTTLSGLSVPGDAIAADKRYAEVCSRTLNTIKSECERDCQNPSLSGFITDREKGACYIGCSYFQKYAAFCSDKIITGSWW